MAELELRSPNMEREDEWKWCDVVGGGGEGCLHY